MDVHIWEEQGTPLQGRGEPIDMVNPEGGTDNSVMTSRNEPGRMSIVHANARQTVKMLQSKGVTKDFHEYFKSCRLQMVSPCGAEDLDPHNDGNEDLDPHNDGNEDLDRKMAPLPTTTVTRTSPAKWLDDGNEDLDRKIAPPSGDDGNEDLDRDQGFQDLLGLELETEPDAGKLEADGDAGNRPWADMVDEHNMWATQTNDNAAGKSNKIRD